MIQSSRPPGEEAQEGISVRQVIRYGVQIAVNLGDSGTRKIELLEVEPMVSKGNKTVQVKVKNVGQRAVRPITKIELYDEQGKKYGPFTSEEYIIYPGCSVNYEVPLKDVPKEKFQSVVIIDNGDEYVWGARKDINFSEDNPPPSKNSSQE